MHGMLFGLSEAGTLRYMLCLARTICLVPCRAFSFSHFTIELLHKGCVGSNNVGQLFSVLTDPEMKVW